jgi:NADH:ubiquinone oxidoreductase subunit E
MTISVCIGSSCHVKRSADIIALLREINYLHY